ncbi:PLDc N-terminal domain-containing protein [Pedobacter frigiditerrae]|uniref:PLDc N-terminal domain-containing protein n=1 Tax=Pedobacter frigiditerrae TaxID=2530452 RepID=UPI00292F6DBB|nr:PLDc N-terminal domain-containing protein [Pedobacter frigiditerrae]
MNAVIIFIYVLVGLWLASIIWAVNDIAKHPYKKKIKKLIWTNIVVVFPFGGLIVYYLMGRKNLSEA